MAADERRHRPGRNPNSSPVCEALRCRGGRLYGVGWTRGSRIEGHMQFPESSGFEGGLLVDGERFGLLSGWHPGLVRTSFLFPHSSFLVLLFSLQ